MTKVITRYFFSFGLTALAISFSGCIQSSTPKSDLPKLKPVSGNITMDGKPLPGVIVTFLPKDEKGSMSIGESDEKGAYKLSFVGMPGAASGDYQVMLSYKTATDGSVVDLRTQSALIMPKRAVGAVERMPAAYAPGTTTLSATVPEAGGSIDFDLKGPLNEAPAPVQTNDSPAKVGKDKPAEPVKPAEKEKPSDSEKSAGKS